MPNTDIRLKLSFQTHPKTKKLRLKLGPVAPLNFIYLLMFVAANKSDGILNEMDHDDIALAADYEGDSDEFVSVLLALRLLDFDSENYSIHDWSENNPYAAHSAERSEHAKKAIKARWDAERMRKANNQQLSPKNDTQSIDGYNGENDRVILPEEKSNTPSPSPSPSPSPFPRDKEDKSSLSAVKPPTCPHSEIVNAFHDVLPELPRILLPRWSGSQSERNLRARWKENPEHQLVEWWERFFQVVRTNPHWMGENDRAWTADLHWLVKRTNFDKVMQLWANMAAAA